MKQTLSPLDRGIRRQTKIDEMWIDFLGLDNAVAELENPFRAGEDPDDDEEELVGSPEKENDNDAEETEEA